MFSHYTNLGCKKNSHCDHFRKNLEGHYSEEEGELFHQDVKETKGRYLVHWNISFMADY